MDSETLAAAQQAMHHLGRRVGDVLSNAVPPVDQKIPGTHLDDLTECFVILIAEAIQSWIDAGSEREVTMENEELFLAIRTELHGWSTLWQEVKD